MIRSTFDGVLSRSSSMPTEDTKVKVVQRLAKIGAELSALEEDEFPSEELTQRLQYLRELRRT